MTGHIGGRCQTSYLACWGKGRLPVDVDLVDVDHKTSILVGLWVQRDPQNFGTESPVEARSRPGRMAGECRSNAGRVPVEKAGILDPQILTRIEVLPYGISL